MKPVLICSLFLLCTILVNSQQARLKSPSSFFPAKKAKILVVGTFHFDYPGLDAIKTADKDKIDVLVDPKKSEVTELVSYIRKFKPTKIAIEATEDWGANEKLRRYKKGEYRNERDERFQLGMRIADELNLDTIYSTDAPSFDSDLTKLDSTYFKELFTDFDFQSKDSFNRMVFEWIRYEEKIQKELSLLQYFKRINSKESHRLGYGAYLVGDFKLDDHRGADALSIWWYNRNLRIFRKLQQITAGSDDRILVIFGNGHAALLRHLIESSPEYDFVEFDSLK
jgi:hypothetical protein